MSELLCPVCKRNGAHVLLQVESSKAQCLQCHALFDVLKEEEDQDVKTLFAGRADDAAALVPIRTELQAMRVELARMKRDLDQVKIDLADESASLASCLHEAMAEELQPPESTPEPQPVYGSARYLQGELARTQADRDAWMRRAEIAEGVLTKDTYLGENAREKFEKIEADLAATREELARALDHFKQAKVERGEWQDAAAEWKRRAGRAEAESYELKRGKLPLDQYEAVVGWKAKAEAALARVEQAEVERNEWQTKAEKLQGELAVTQAYDADLRAERDEANRLLAEMEARVEALEAGRAADEAVKVAAELVQKACAETDATKLDKDLTARERDEWHACAKRVEARAEKAEARVETLEACRAADYDAKLKALAECNEAKLAAEDARRALTTCRGQRSKAEARFEAIDAELAQRETTVDERVSKAERERDEAVQNVVEWKAKTEAALARAEKAEEERDELVALQKMWPRVANAAASQARAEKAEADRDMWQDSSNHLRQVLGERDEGIAKAEAERDDLKVKSEALIAETRRAIADRDMWQDSSNHLRQALAEQKVKVEATLIRAEKAEDELKACDGDSWKARAEKADAELASLHAFAEKTETELARWCSRAKNAEAFEKAEGMDRDRWKTRAEKAEADLATAVSERYACAQRADESRARAEKAEEERDEWKAREGGSWQARAEKAEADLRRWPTAEAEIAHFRSERWEVEAVCNMWRDRARKAVRSARGLQTWLVELKAILEEAGERPQNHISGALKYAEEAERSRDGWENEP